MVTVKLSDHIVSDGKICKIAEENPDLAYDLIKNILISKNEALQEKTQPYILEKNKIRKTYFLIN